MDEAKLAYLIRDRTITKTQLMRQKKLTHWVPFLRSKGWDESSGWSEYLDYADGTLLNRKEATQLVGLYAIYLVEHNCAAKEGLLALADWIKGSGRGLPPGVFDSSYVKEAKKSHTRDQGREAATGLMDREIHAIPGDILVEAFDVFCPEGSDLKTMNTMQVHRVYQVGMAGLLYTIMVSGDRILGVQLPYHRR